MYTEHGIDEECFHLLDEDTLKELIPRIGTRLRFKQKLSLNRNAVSPDPHSGVVLQRQKRDTFEYVPIRDLLLEVLDADLLEAIRQYKTREHEPGILEDFKDGSYYKSNPTLCDPETISILLYFDELETTNPFSPKAGTHKLGLFYFTLKDVHPGHQSSLKNMFLLAVALSKDIKHYGFNALLNPIVDDLKVLESEGLLCDDGTKVRVVLGQTTGDNLGLHGMLGFAEGYTANFPCHRCSMPRDDAHTATAEDDSLIRTVETYNRDIAVDDVSRTGVKRMCPLNDLVEYHVTDNHVFDIMHDILEGVGLIEVKLVLKVIITEGVLTLDVINDRVVSFDYGFPESSNKPSVITEQSLNRSTSATGQKAEQAYFLIRHLLILIGDLVPEDTCNDHLQVIRLLLSCIDIIFAPKGNHRNSHVYSRIAELLKLEGYDRTTDQCRNKLKSMKGDWVKAHNNLGRSDTSGRNGFGDEELEILDEVLGTRPIHNPRHIVETMFDRPGAGQHDGDGRNPVRIVSERS
ncbi:uncharacterized protein LOC135496091 [Lineus longissimus]|uniref:uncharacterized protein LOC135496091 n=1 Tax=Lineus longissimus TaxID=88925 RepID=UPI00315DDAB8